MNPARFIYVVWIAGTMWVSRAIGARSGAQVPQWEWRVGDEIRDSWKPIGKSRPARKQSSYG